jgi:hypothetical protein
MDSNLGAPLDLQSLLSPREAEASGSLRMRNSYGMKIRARGSQGRRDCASRGRAATSRHTATTSRLQIFCVRHR